MIACGNEEREVPRESAQAKAKTCEAGMETGTQGERSEREGRECGWEAVKEEIA